MLTRLLLITAALGLCAAVACSDDDDDSTPTPSVCDSRDALTDSVANLASADVLADGLDGIETAFEDVQDDIATLKESVSADTEDEVDDLETAVSDAQEVISSLDDDSGLAEKIGDVQTAISGITTASAALLQALAQDCG